MSEWMNECWPIVFKENLGYVWHVFYFLNVRWSMIVVLVSAVHWNASAIGIHISPLFRISCPFRSSQNTESPVLYSRFLLITCFIHSGVYVPIPVSQCIPPSFPPLNIFLIEQIKNIQKNILTKKEKDSLKSKS